MLVYLSLSSPLYLSSYVMYSSYAIIVRMNTPWWSQPHNHRLHGATWIHLSFVYRWILPTYISLFEFINFPMTLQWKNANNSAFLWLEILRNRQGLLPSKKYSSLQINMKFYYSFQIGVFSIGGSRIIFRFLAPAKFYNMKIVEQNFLRSKFHDRNRKATWSFHLCRVPPSVTIPNPVSHQTPNVNSRYTPHWGFSTHST